MERMYTKFAPEQPPQMEQQIGISTIIITFIVAYVLIKILLSSSQEDDQAEDDSQTIKTTNYLKRKQHICKEKEKCDCEKKFAKKDLIYRKEARRRDPIQSRPTYRAFNCAGDESKFFV